MNLIKISLMLFASGFCALASAQRVPSGYNYAKGDFNGDGNVVKVYKTVRVK